MEYLIHGHYFVLKLFQSTANISYLNLSTQYSLLYIYHFDVLLRIFESNDLQFLFDLPQSYVWLTRQLDHRFVVFGHSKQSPYDIVPLL